MRGNRVERVGPVRQQVDGIAVVDDASWPVDRAVSQPDEREDRLLNIRVSAESSRVESSRCDGTRMAQCDVNRRVYDFSVSLIPTIPFVNRVHGHVLHNVWSSKHEDWRSPVALFTFSRIHCALYTSRPRSFRVNSRMCVHYHREDKCTYPHDIFIFIRNAMRNMMIVNHGTARRSSCRCACRWHSNFPRY